MNERIQELARQVGAKPIYYEFLTGYEIPGKDGLEKFAVLIIEECIKICEDMDGVDNFEQMMNPRTPRYDCVCEIKEHFGVEK